MTETVIGQIRTASGSVFDVGYRQDEVGWVVFARRRSDGSTSRLLWTLTEALAEEAARRYAAGAVQFPVLSPPSPGYPEGFGGAGV